MKYTITINQLGLYYAGLNFKTDWNDWAIIDYLKDFAIHQKSKRIYIRNEPRPSRTNNHPSVSNLPKYAHNSQNSILTTEGRGEEYVWLNYNHLIANLPFCKFQGKWTVSRRIAKLRRLGLIRMYRAKDNTLYVAFTDKLIDICWAKRTDIEKMRRIAGTLTENVGQGFSLAKKDCHPEFISGSPNETNTEMLNQVQHDINQDKATSKNKEVIHNLPTPVADKNNRGCYTANATAQIETKYPIETKNNKDISFSSSLKPNTKDSHRFTPHLLSNGIMINKKINSSSQQHQAIGAGELRTISHSRVNGNPDIIPVKAMNCKNWIPASAGMTPPCAPYPGGKEVKGFKAFSIVWKVIENIKQRGLHNDYNDKKTIITMESANNESV